MKEINVEIRYNTYEEDCVAKKEVDDMVQSIVSAYFERTLATGEFDVLALARDIRNESQGLLSSYTIIEPNANIEYNNNENYMLGKVIAERYEEEEEEEDI